MKRTYFLINFILLIVSLSVPSILSAQNNSVTVDLQLFIPDNGIIFFDDIDLSNMSNAPVLFSITLTNNDTNSKIIRLQIGMKRNGQEIIKGTTYPFPLQPGVTSLTNRDLGINPDFSETDINLGELQEIVYATGKLPEGQYEFFVRVLLEQSTIHQDIEILNISGPPTVLDLLAPGQLAENNNLMEIYTALPFFLWHSNASKFRITICEKLPTNNSPADVMNNEPRLQQIVENFTFFQYPASSVWPLEPGKTYYWQIVAITESSSGPVELESEIWGFKIGNISAGMLAIYHQQLLNLLFSILNDGDLRALFESGGALDGFTFTGVMLNNGRMIAMEDLLAIVEQVFSGRIIVDGFVVE